MLLRGAERHPTRPLGGSNRVTPLSPFFGGDIRQSQAWLSAVQGALWQGDVRGVKNQVQAQISIHIAQMPKLDVKKVKPAADQIKVSLELSYRDRAGGTVEIERPGVWKVTKPLGVSTLLEGIATFAWKPDAKDAALLDQATGLKARVRISGRRSELFAGWQKDPSHFLCGRGFCQAA